MRIEPEIGGSSIVLLGSFNPGIFTPHWFARWEIVSKQEADTAEIFVIHPEIANFRLGSKLVTVETSRFAAETTEGPWVILADFVVSTFKELDERTGSGQRGASLDASGYDAGKKVLGRKRHVLTDTLELLLAVVVHPASVQNRDGARAPHHHGARAA